MRNLDEYPLTYQETLDTMDDLAEKELRPNGKDVAYGSMSPFIIGVVTSFLIENQKLFEEYLKKSAR